MGRPRRRAATAGLAFALVLGVVACDKKPSPPPAPAPLIAPSPAKPDPVLTPAELAVRRANQMDRTDAARCSIVFATVGDAFKKSRKADAAKEAASYLQAANYLAQLPMAGQTEPPQYPDVQAAVTRESKTWTADQRSANFSYCLSQFQNLHALLDAAGEFKNKK